MAKIINIEEYARNRKFQQQVLAFFDTLDYPSLHFLEDQEAVVALKTHAYLFIFLTYIKDGIHTALPNVGDRFLDIKRNPRTSSGEWVVEHIFELDQREAKKMISKLSAPKGPYNGIADLKSRLRK